MSDNYKALSSGHYVPAILFVAFGLTIHPAFFLGAIAALADSKASRNRKIAVAFIATFCMIIAFGYGIGKDMANRDNHAAAINRGKTP